MRGDSAVHLEAFRACKTMGHASMVRFRTHFGIKQSVFPDPIAVKQPF